jgi:hypothetical protein
MLPGIGTSRVSSDTDVIGTPRFAVRGVPIAQVGIYRAAPVVIGFASLVLQCPCKILPLAAKTGTSASLGPPPTAVSRLASASQLLLQKQISHFTTPGPAKADHGVGGVSCNGSDVKHDDEEVGDQVKTIMS